MYEYVNKLKTDYKTEDIEADFITYKIDTDIPKELLNEILSEIDLTTKVVLYKDNIYDLLVDNSEDGSIITLGITSENELMIMYYKVHKGIEHLLEKLNSY